MNRFALERLVCLYGEDKKAFLDAARDVAKERRDRRAQKIAQTVLAFAGAA